jgi:DNA-binding response OmpR family regulator
MDAAAVIYIEDDETEALLFKLGLNQRGIDVLHISDSNADSLGILETDEYQRARAVFFDLWVGVVNGVELAAGLRNNGDTRPFFLLTAGENPNPSGLQAINLTYMQKPPDFPKVAEMIHAMPQR